MMNPNEKNNEEQRTPLSEEVKPQKQPRRIPLSAAIFLALFLCVAVFLSTFTVMMVRMQEEQNELNARYAKYAKLEQLMTHLDNNYVRDYDESQLWESIYSALYDAVDDPYTEYMTKEEFEAYTADRSGNYVGIGISVVFDPDSEGIYIHRVTTDSPAQNAGLLPGDIIVSVGDLALSENTYTDAVNAIIGESGTAVELTVRRGEETLQLSVTRGQVVTENVTYEKIEGSVAYITIVSFSETVTYDQFSNALERAKADGCTSYLFDVRNNPGGNLDVICNCLDLLLPEGITVNIVDAAGTVTTRESDAEHFLDAPMAVLCNGNTASAAELFTADLRDYGLATIVGETTYGKGTMQTISPMGDGSAVKLTTRYYNPMSNVSYDGVGIKPDEGYEVILTEEQNARFYLLSNEEDPQLQAALRALRTEAEN